MTALASWTVDLTFPVLICYLVEIDIFLNMKTVIISSLEYFYMNLKSI